MKRILKIAGVVAVLELAGFLAGFFVTENAVATWYRDIAKSPINPPDWLFGPAWTLLYALLGIALYRLWQHRHASTGRRALAFFLIQLIANLAWSTVFFGMQAFTAAFMLLAFIVLFTILAMFAARRVDRAVPWLMAPYLGWVSFATYLTWYVMAHN